MNAPDLGITIRNALAVAIGRLDAGEEVDLCELEQFCVEAARRDPAVILAAAMELPEFKALMEAAVDGKQALMDAADEIAELRLALSKLDLELPWISDAIDQLTTALAALAALKPDTKGGA